LNKKNIFSSPSEEIEKSFNKLISILDIATGPDPNGNSLQESQEAFSNFCDLLVLSKDDDEILIDIKMAWDLTQLAYNSKGEGAPLSKIKEYLERAKARAILREEKRN